jgi:hypothetical protein
MLRAALVCALVAAPGAARAELGINLYGASYHFERERARELGFTNEFNPGLGLRLRRSLGERFDFIADAGAYRDSARHTAFLAGAGVLWHAVAGARLGAAAVLLKSPTYNDGDLLLVPAPVAAYEWRGVTLNAVYFPRYRDLNPTNVLGFWLTVWPKGF